MNRKTFTPDELLQKQQNRYVKSATSNSNRFIFAFKEKFLEQYEKYNIPYRMGSKKFRNPYCVHVNSLLYFLKQVRYHISLIQFNKLDY
ncbi:MAG: hypothetical protein KMY55_10905 [Dethiosulfatibacter sp.]|nr:hypothetical protein [Dethiosulfatibacter sp.]